MFIPFNKRIFGFLCSYEPIFYKRTGDLKNVFKVKIDIKNQTFELIFDSAFMKNSHRALNSCIFDISFMQGWHGGAATISSNKIEKYGKHPSEGTPY